VIENSTLVGPLVFAGICVGLKDKVKPSEAGKFEQLDGEPLSITMQANVTLFGNTDPTGVAVKE